jgi:hypothetical protein
MSAYDIRAAVRAVMDETDLTSPEEIAAKVAESVPAKSLRAVLATVLRDYVRIELGRDRSPVLRPAPTGSAKVRAYREYAQRWLRERVFVGDSGWKLLGDCTYENLRYLEQERLVNAERSRLAAARYATLAELVQRHSVARVADLPAALLTEAEGQVAA